MNTEAGKIRDSSNGVSIIVCCYNSAPRITPTLQHLFAQQQKPGLSLEIILVDNNCTDETVPIAKAIAARHEHATPLVIVAEKDPGLIYARKKGIETARYEYIIFCDDDNWLAADYVSLSYDYLRKNDAIGAMGGNIKATSSIELPEWFAAKQQNYAVGKQGESATAEDVTHALRLFGAGLVSRRKILLRVFHPDFPFFSTGRLGGSASSGDDDELCVRVVLLGYQLWYSPLLRLTHFIAPHRLTSEYNQKVEEGFQQPFQYFLSYSRAYKCLQTNEYSYRIKSFIKYIVASVSGNRHQLSWARDEMYYRTGNVRFRNDINRRVKAFCDFAGRRSTQKAI